jgi:hypothetical protein
MNAATRPKRLLQSYRSSFSVANGWRANWTCSGRVLGRKLRFSSLARLLREGRCLLPDMEEEGKE